MSFPSELYICLEWGPGPSRTRTHIIQCAGSQDRTECRVLWERPGQIVLFGLYWKTRKDYWSAPDLFIHLRHIYCMTTSPLTPLGPGNTNMNELRLWQKISESNWRSREVKKKNITYVNGLCPTYSHPTVLGKYKISWKSFTSKKSNGYKFPLRWLLGKRPFWMN